MKQIVAEWCPHCDREQSFEWDIENDGLHAFCPYCGERLMLCSQCLNENENCDFDAEKDKCKFQDKNILNRKN